MTSSEARQAFRRTPVPILQSEDEFAALLELYCERAPSRVLEIGTRDGGTFYHWLRSATPGTMVVSIDPGVEADNSRYYSSWCPSGVEWATIRGYSAEPKTVAAARTFAPYDWLFVDGDHREAAVRRDWLLYSDLLASPAVAAFHDITETEDPTVEVAPLWRELREQHKTSAFCSEPGRWGIGVVFLP